MRAVPFGQDDERGQRRLVGEKLELRLRNRKVAAGGGPAHDVGDVALSIVRALGANLVGQEAVGPTPLGAHQLARANVEVGKLGHNSISFSGPFTSTDVIV